MFATNNFPIFFVFTYLYIYFNGGGVILHTMWVIDDWGNIECTNQYDHIILAHFLALAFMSDKIFDQKNPSNF